MSEGRDELSRQEGQSPRFSRCFCTSALASAKERTLCRTPMLLLAPLTRTGDVVVAVEDDDDDDEEDDVDDESNEEAAAARFFDWAFLEGELELAVIEASVALAPALPRRPRRRTHVTAGEAGNAKGASKAVRLNPETKFRNMGT